MMDTASIIRPANVPMSFRPGIPFLDPSQHKHNHNIHGGRFQNLKTGKYYDIWVCACGDEKIVYV